MNDKKQYQRREFIKLAALTGLGFYISSCQSNNKKENARNDTAVHNTPKNTTTSKTNDNVTFYKKDDEQYDRLRQVYNKRIQKYPAIITVCKNTQGVVEAIHYAQQNNLPVAIKSGGHSFQGFITDYENNDSEIKKISDALSILVNKTTVNQSKNIANALKVYYGA